MKKRLNLFLVFFTLAFYAGAQTITVTNVTPAEPYCAGSQITVDYTVGLFIGTDNFTIELGNFGAFPGTILATNSHGWGARSFTVTIPPNTALGNYRIRVNRTGPVVNSNQYFLGEIKAQEIAIVPRATTWCAGSTQQINYNIACGAFNATNDFTIQLSDATGSFAAPVTIGTVSNFASGSGTASVTIPATAAGEFYKIRFVSNSPVVTQTLSTPITIVGQALCNCTNATTIDWQSSFGGTAIDQFYYSTPTPDGGYLFAGESTSGIGGNKTTASLGGRDIWVVKTDAAGVKQWETAYGGTADEFLNVVIPTNDGGYLLGGRSTSGIGGNKTTAAFGAGDYWIVKIDAAGTKLFDQTYGGTGLDQLFSVVETTDGGFLLGGTSASGITGNKTTASFGSNDFWIIKTNASGTMIWESVYGGTASDNIQKIIPTADGYILAGQSLSGATGNKTTANLGVNDYWIVKIDLDGVKQWENTFGGTLADDLQSAVPTADGGFILAGYSASGVTGNKTTANFGSSDYWIIKINNAGTKQWERSFGGTAADNLFSIIATSANEFILGGNSSSGVSGTKTSASFGNADYWILKIDANGNELRQETYGGTLVENLQHLLPTSDDGYLICGESTSAANGNKTTANLGSNDYWLVKVAPPLELSATARTTTICAGNTLDIDYSTSCASFKAGNNIKVELSDATGSFASATTLLTQATVAASGTLTVTIPTTAVGEFYKIRVIASSPIDTVIIGSLFTIVASAQCNCTDSTTIDWQASFGGTLNDNLNIMIPTSDGGYLLGGTSSSNAGINKTRNTFGLDDYWIVKIDANGTKQWDSIYGGTGTEEIYSIVPTIDGGYLLAGFSNSNISGNKTRNTFGSNDYWIVKINANGTKQWDSIYGGTSSDRLQIIIPTNDGGYLLGGRSESNTSGNKTRNTFGGEDYWLVKINANGTKQWDSIYGGTSSDNLKIITQTLDGGYFLGGFSNSNASGNKTRNTFGQDDYWLVKIDVNGTKQWDSIYGGSDIEALYSITPTNNGGYLLGGHSQSNAGGNKTRNTFGFRDYWLVKINANGTKQWDSIYGGTSDDELNTIIPTNDGGYLLGGGSFSTANGNKTTVSFGNFDYWVVKINANGTKINEKGYGGNMIDEVNTMIPTNDGGYLIGGESISGINGNKTTANFGSFDYWIVKVAQKLELSATARTTTICAGNTLDIDYSTSCTSLKAGNNLKVELSNATGSFASATTLLTQATVAASGTLTVTIPASAAGEFYKIRVSSSSPKDTVIIGNLFTIVATAQCSCTDENTIDWQASFGGTTNDAIDIMIPTSDGGYLLGGWSQSNAGGNKTRNSFGNYDYWLVKIDANGTKQWDSIYGGTDGDYLYSIVSTNDGGYLLGGSSQSIADGNKTRSAFGVGLTDYWIVKIDANGTKQWDSIYGGTVDDRLYSIISTNDGGYLLVGNSNSNISGNKTRNKFGQDDYWIVKIDANGTKQWDSIYGGTNYDNLYSIIPSSDGGFLLGGTSQSNASGNKTRSTFGLIDYWLVKIDENGTKQWDSIYGGINSDLLESIISTTDGGFLLAGYSSSNASGNKTRNTFGLEDYWLVKIDANGTKQWDSIYGGTVGDKLSDIKPTADGNYLLSGLSASLISGNKTTNTFGSNDYWVVKINANGTKLKENVYGGIISDFDPLIIATDDGGFLFGGLSNSDINGNKTTVNFGSLDYWIVKVAPAVELSAIARTTTICGGNTLDIDYSITSCNNFKAGNNLKVELSDATGSFASATTLLTQATVASSGTLTVTIPASAVGEFYKIRVSSSSPIDTVIIGNLFTIVATEQCNCTDETVIDWQASFGGTASDQLTITIPTADGGYMLGGESSSNASGNKTRNSFGITDFWIVKIDANGTKQWDSIYGGTSTEGINSIIATPDGGYLLGGYSSSNASGNKTRNGFGGGDYWVVKIDANGTKQWDSIYGGTSVDQLSSIVSTSDGGFLLGGYSQSPSSGNKTRNTFGFYDYWVVKINANGTKQWDSIYGGTDYEEIYTIIPTSDGGFLLGGYSQSNASGNKTRNSFGVEDYWIVKIDANGTKQWDSIYGGTASENFSDIISTGDGGYLLGGYSASNASGNKTRNTFGSNDYWIVKINANGLKQWDSIYGGTAIDNFRDMVSTNDGGYILGGYSQSGINGNKTINSFGNYDYWSIKINENGTKIKEKVYGGTTLDAATSKIATKDGGYLISGYSSSGINGNKTTANFGNNDYWVVKVAPTLELSATPRTTTICAGNTLDIDYSIASCSNFKAGNNLKVELSNAAGSFASATTLLTQATVAASGTLTVTIPTTATGEFYKIRVSSSSLIDTVIIGSLFTVVTQSQCNCIDETVIDWQASFGGTALDILNITIPTSDGGYLLGGYSSSNTGGNKTRNTFGNNDYWIVKIDANGIKQWDSIYGGTNIDELNEIIPTNDGGYLLGGYSSSPASGNKTRNSYGQSDYWIVKINANGTKQWDSIYGGSNFDQLTKIIASSDDGYLLGGFSLSSASGNKTTNSYGSNDYWVVKIDANGTKQWENNYGGTSTDQLNTIIAISDGGYLLGGLSQSNANGNKTRNSFGGTDYWLVKINANGTKQWDSIYGGTSTDWLSTIVATSDNGYLLGGYSSSLANGNKSSSSYGADDYWLVKIDANGTKQWENIYGGTSTDALLSNALVATSNGNFLLGGSSQSNISGNKTLNSFGSVDYWVVTINANGTKINEKVYGGLNVEYSRSMIAAKDGGYLIGGYSATGIDGNKTTANFGNYDYWLVKVAPAVELSATPRTTTICAGNTLDIDYSINSCNTFKAGNNLKVELSDAAGSFASATTLLTQATVATSGTLTVTIPAAATGEFYKIRLSSTSPIDTVIIGNLFTVVTQSQCNCTDETVIDWQASFGGTLSDELNIMIPTSDGGYLLGGASASNASGNKTRNTFGLTDFWVVKIDANGTKQWDSIYGGISNDRLTTIISTTDGGYLLGGRSESIASGNKTRNTFGGSDYWLIKIDANGTKQWDSVYGGIADDYCTTIHPVNDGFLLGGNSLSTISGNKTSNGFGFSDYWLIKINVNGAKQWDITFGGTSDDIFSSIVSTSDGGYILGGHSQSNANGNKTRNSFSFGLRDYWLIKINANGVKQWDSIYGGTSIDGFNSIVPTNDGGFLLGGYSASNISGNKTSNSFGSNDYWLVKIDANGTKQWDSIYGGTSNDVISKIVSTNDGGYLLSGSSQSSTSGNKTSNSFGNIDYWVVKINDSGTKINEETYGGSNADLYGLIVTTKDGGYLLGGYSLSNASGNKTTANFGSDDYWLVKVAPELELSATPRTTTICAGNTLDIDYSTTSCSNFKAGNNLKVELSNAAGSFVSATTLLTQATVAASGTLTVTIPNTATGEFYKIRVSSSSQIDTVIIGNLFTIVTQSQCNCTNETVIDWQASFGGTAGDVLNIMIPTSDGGYLLGGYSTSNASANKTRNSFGGDDYWIVKTDANGTKQWDSIYGGTVTDQLNTIVPTSDGGYLLGGYSTSNANGNKTRNSFGFSDYWVVKIDANGTKQWDSIYGGSLGEELNTIISTKDGGYLLGGFSASGLATGNKTRASFGQEDYWVVKINANGVKQWDSIYGGTNEDLLRNILPTADGGYLLGGTSISNSSGNKTRNSYGSYDYWVVKINANGTKQWDSIYGGTNSEDLKVIISTSDGGYMFCGSSNSLASGNKTRSTFGSYDYWIVKINANGSKQWDSIYGGANLDYSYSVVSANDGSYLIGGYSSSAVSGNKTTTSFGSNDYWLVKIDANGTRLNEKGYGGTSIDNPYSIIATKDGGYLIGGYSQSGITGNKTTSSFGITDFWVVKVVPAPKITPVSVSRAVVCSPDSLTVFFDKDLCGSFKTGNKFYVQLSDSLGSFTTPFVLDSITSIVTPNSIIAQTPSGLTESATYQIRIVSSLPTVISDTVSNIQIITYPNISTLTESCSLGKEFSAVVPASSSKQWQLNGVDIGSATASSYFPIQFGNYRLRTFNAGCRDTSAVYSVVPANIASANTCVIADGLTRFICDNSTGEVIAKIVDAAGGNVLDSTTADMYIDASVQYYQTQPYVQRHYDITPKSSGAAAITLYVPQSEYNAYNTVASTFWPHLPSGPADVANMNNLVVTQYHGISATHLPGTYSGATEYMQFPAVINTWNASTSMWEVNFSISAFSGIFLHTRQNFSLPVELINFSGKYVAAQAVVKLSWQTASELNCAHFEVERMKADGTFEYIGTVDCHGTTNMLNSYTLDDPDYIIGNNYYRLKQVDENGNIAYSKIAIVKVTATNEFYFQTFTDNELLTIFSSESGDAALYDNNGRLLQTIKLNENTMHTSSINYLAKGVYFIRFENEQNIKTNKIIKK